MIANMNMQHGDLGIHGIHRGFYGFLKPYRSSQRSSQVFTEVLTQ